MRPNPTIHDPGIAALGSQRLAARVSPIILVRRFGPGVHSITSTAVRDPRGEAISDSRLIRKADGSVVLGGAWKTHMLAEVYWPRVLELLEAEPGSEMTVVDVSTALDITYEVAQACLTTGFKNGLLNRAGDGKKASRSGNQQSYRTSIGKAWTARPRHRETGSTGGTTSAARPR